MTLFFLLWLHSLRLWRQHLFCLLD